MWRAVGGAYRAVAVEIGRSEEQFRWHSMGEVSNGSGHDVSPPTVLHRESDAKIDA